MNNFAVVMRGYNQKEVDACIEELKEQISWYKDRENTIKNCILVAEQTANDIVKEAEFKARVIMDNARRVEYQVMMNLDEKEAHLGEIEQEMKNSVEKYIQLIKQVSLDDVRSKIATLSGRRSYEHLYVSTGDGGIAGDS